MWVPWCVHFNLGDGRGDDSILVLEACSDECLEALMILWYFWFLQKGHKPALYSYPAKESFLRLPGVRRSEDARRK